MLILIDKRIPEMAKSKLATFGELIEFETQGIVYDAISGHPDIFFCQTPEYLIIAPNTPQKYVDLFIKKGIPFKIGEKEVGNSYPFTSFYNSVVTNNLLIHNTKYTDTVIMKTCLHQSKIKVNQSYTRCNLISLNENTFITSDKGILDKLKLSKIKNVFFTEANQIELPGFKNGFLGGCCGIYKNHFFIIGKLDLIDKGHEMQEFIQKNNFNIIELTEEKLFDGGSILFLDY